ncbi:MAG: hypothetical protein JRG89_02765 [Deltaproteobacteria bacterium]|nr:hypothetical protein [Deltaproteobacteria bacterium]
MSLPVVAPNDGVRSRRWDAVILGSGISALVTAARLGMAGQRVLIVEEEATRTCFAGLREPFFLAGARNSGILQLCLRELTLSLIDRRRIEEEEISLQLVGRDLRPDVGRAELTAEELVAWGVCKPDPAHRLVRSLAEASEAERKAMLSSPLVRLGRRMGRSRPGVEGSHRRGLPAEAANANPELARLLNAQVRALSNLATATPGPEAQARLLGSLLEGGAGFQGGPPWLHEILRRRVESVFGEFRTLSRKFRLVSVMNQPGIAVQGSSEIWAGRMLIIAAPPTALASILEPKDTPDFLKKQRKSRQRLCVHLRVRRRVLPEGMSKRVVLLNEPGSTGEPGALATLSVFMRDNDPKWVDLVIRSIALEGLEPAEQEQRLVERVLALMPFHEDQVERIAIKQPRWDDDNCLEDPAHGACWPGELDLRATAKLPIYMLDRSWVGGLGLEGDLLLGLRAGEILQKELG